MVNTQFIQLRRVSLCVILSAAKEPGVQESAGIELCPRLSSSSAPRAPSEVEVSCTEKDPGFFAALRMTQRLERGGLSMHSTRSSYSQ